MQITLARVVQQMTDPWQHFVIGQQWEVYMSNGNTIPLPIKRPAHDIARARRARDEAEIEQAISARMAQYELWCAEQRATIPLAQEALARLLTAALNGTGDGQAEICRDFLLGLQNGQKHPFNLARLRRLEIEQWQDCMAVLQLHQYSRVPLHLSIEDGERIWQQLKTPEPPRTLRTER